MTSPDARHDARAAGAERLCWVGLIGIATIAAIRCMTLLVPERFFDVDPALHAEPLAALGPAASLALDVLLLLCCAVGLIGELRSGRALDPVLIVLALAPLPVALAHGAHDAGDMWRGGTWCAAAVAAASVAHLSRDGARRAACLGLLLGVLVPLLARGALQMTVEHADTVAAFEQTREQFLAERGWPPDSPAALIYERRLRQPQPRGWFETSNILASLMAFGLVTAAGLSLASIRGRLASGWSGTAALLGLAAAAALWLSGSKGAAGAALVGLALIALVSWRPAAAAWIARRRGRVTILLVALVLGAVVARGTLVPERFLGDLSLLFRWHYLQGAAAMLGEALPWGIGPDHFQEWYARFRPGRSPEEVISAHSQLIDWTIALGILGISWVALVLRSLRERAEPETGDDPSPGRTVALACGIVVVLSVTVGILVERTTLDPLTGLVRVLGGAGFMVVAVVAAAIARGVAPAAVGWVVGAAAVTLLVHGQIEMTFFAPGAVVWAMVAVGLAAAPAARAGRLFGAAMVATVVAGAAWIAVTAWWPAARQAVMIRAAAAALQPPAGSASALAAQRESAIGLLERAYAAWPANDRPLLAASRQAAAAAATGRDDMWRVAADLAGRAVAVHGSTASVVAAADVAARAALERPTPEAWSEAVALAERVTELDPMAIASWTRLGDVLWAAGRRPEAAEAYRSALQRSDDFELDPLKQLSPARRAQLEERLGG